ncbi:MAG: NAD-dependent dihydroorotate dehydrogenase B electron transfer subunit [Candidatus Goldiibacteriota bacterium HGW-Goldbacteria-1]|jgi:dihydroorotate dehydrogenase electron transfer subunit|nr:MAG: NAD-dependent dihydroorotate dehydrogenase B electron transfer subunit [Candidatus Goldiibacteriota bacterium HGW-Goldbacteria-1]
MKNSGEVVFNKNTGEGLYHMRLAVKKKFKACPAQFINIKVSDTVVPLLRRPFSIFSAENKELDIVYKVIGEGTRLLSEKKKGDVLDFIGPQGNTYPVDLKDKKSKIIIIGGGTGAASVHFLAQELKKKKRKFTLIQGARNKKLIVADKEFKKLGCLFATEDGSLGTRGYVTDVLKKELAPNAVIYACGPEGMIKAIKEKIKGMDDIKFYASFEAYMACGIGACISCVIPVGIPDNFVYKRVCKEGTVFDVSEVVL